MVDSLMNVQNRMIENKEKNALVLTLVHPTKMARINTKKYHAVSSRGLAPWSSGDSVVG